jgi:transposase
VVYVDEAGTDDTECYLYGWCERSQRFHDLQLGHRTCRINMIAAWCGHDSGAKQYRQLLAPMTFSGNCNSALVEAWAEQVLVPVLKHGQLVIFDNASFHKSLILREIIEQADCQVVFLPAYSPDLNKIEKFWARLKHYIRKTIHQFEYFGDTVDHAFKLLS